MEQKVCENCGAKIHPRTVKCPICNILLTDASQIVDDEITPQDNIGKNIDIQITDSETINNKESIENVEPSNKSDVKDYVYKAEVRHSLEYTKPMSNGLKVFITAISTLPMLGQFLGTFLGIFFCTYDDNDRKSFGKALIFLSITSKYTKNNLPHLSV